jgi:hypothetical protein
MSQSLNKLSKWLRRSQDVSPELELPSDEVLEDSASATDSAFGPEDNNMPRLGIPRSNSPPQTLLDSYLSNLRLLSSG